MDLALVMPLTVSWGMSPQWPSLISPRYHVPVGTAMWILASSGSLMEAFCGAESVVSE